MLEQARGAVVRVTRNSRYVVHTADRKPAERGQMGHAFRLWWLAGGANRGVC
jgi:hypothetical protein